MNVCKQLGRLAVLLPDDECAADSTLPSRMDDYKRLG